MKCPYCGCKVYYSPALKGALRHGPVERQCNRCKRCLTIRPEDIVDPITRRTKPKTKWTWMEENDGNQIE